MCAERRRRVRDPRRQPGRRRLRGFTLPEALLAIVVIGVGLTGVLAAFGSVTRNSADPVVHKQMIAVAQALLEEIALKPFAEAAHTAPTGCARDSFNDVRDYNGYASSGVCSVDGVAIPALAGLQVAASVATGTLGGVAGALKITVTVQHSGQTLTLTGWRTDYGS
ncbi:MAG: prepilin-type N-terminal cleavage/methylation domain-containing protein [Aquabacterium sp.]|nr:prepilin-type N-terminal cleavage/methylation domain-containing protein [Aquabacterium sp.]